MWACHAPEQKKTFRKNLSGSERYPGGTQNNLKKQNEKSTQSDMQLLLDTNWSKPNLLFADIRSDSASVNFW